MHDLTWPQKIFLLLAAILYVGSGILHFAKTDTYIMVMPPYIPWHLALVRISGFCEILGGIGLLVPATRRLAAWGLVALLIAVLPANVYMATNPVQADAVGISAALRWGRLPLQLVLITWLLWCSKSRPRGMRPAFRT
jgi:uncharacterized membrane protein